MYSEGGNSKSKGFFKTNKEKGFFASTLILGLLMVGIIVACVILGWKYMKMRNEAKSAISYAAGMVNQSQTLLDATSTLRDYYRNFEYFDSNGTDSNVDVTISGTIGTTAIGSDNSEWSVKDYTATTQCIRKGLSVSDLLDTIGISNYLTYSSQDTSIDGGTSLNDSYIKFSYKYPSDVSKTITYNLNGYFITSSDNLSSVVATIKSNWISAITS